MSITTKSAAFLGSWARQNEVMPSKSIEMKNVEIIIMMPVTTIPGMLVMNESDGMSLETMPLTLLPIESKNVFDPISTSICMLASAVRIFSYATESDGMIVD